MDRVYDAVVIGAGPSGLAAAARLAHFGASVCVLEAHARIGGYSSWHHVGGREISSGLHAFTNFSPDGRGGPLGKLLRQLRVKYHDLRLRPQGRSSIRFPSATLAFSNDTELIREEIARTFPGQADGFDRLRRRIRETDEGELTLRQSPARPVVEDYIRDPLLVDMLLCPVMFYGNPGGVGDGLDATRVKPDMDWLLFCVVWKCIFESGFGFPAGGMRRIWEMLAERIRADGGDVRLSAKVEGLSTDNAGNVTEARLSDGDEVWGKVFFSSAGGPETEALLGAAPAERKPVGTVSIAEGISLLDAPPAAAGMTDTIIFYSLSDEFAFRRPEGLTELSGGVVCAPGNYLPHDPDGENIIKATALASYPAWRALPPDAYADAKREAADGMERTLASLGVRPAAARTRTGRYGAFDDFFTPVTLERYTSHLEGALYGSPVKSRTGETSRANLFLIGADQGFHGIVGAMLSGVAMANFHVLTVK